MASAALGVLLMATPLVFGTEPPLYFSDHIAGCLVIMVAVTAMAEVARPVRFLNVPIGLADRGITVPIRGRHTDWDGGSSDHWPGADRSELAPRDPQRRALWRLGSRNRLT